MYTHTKQSLQLCQVSGMENMPCCALREKRRKGGREAGREMKRKYVHTYQLCMRGASLGAVTSPTSRANGVARDCTL